MLRQTRLEKLLWNRAWCRSRVPYAHVYARDVFRLAAYRSIEDAVRRLLARGTREEHSRDHLSRNMPLSDAYSWAFPPRIDDPLAVFYSRAWLDLLASVIGVEHSTDVSAAVHHHRANSAAGFVHRDLHVGWFTDQPRADGVNPIDMDRCGFLAGPEASHRGAREVVRAVTMIFFVANPPWAIGDGGETALYRHADDRVDRPTATVPPINNSILVFENTPRAYHAFLSNVRGPRSSVIVWLHRSRAAATRRFRATALERAPADRRHPVRAARAPS